MGAVPIADWGKAELIDVAAVVAAIACVTVVPLTTTPLVLDAAT